MSNSSRIDRHQDLFTRMAESQGVDLDLEMQKGNLDPVAYRDGVMSCTGCAEPDRCEKALDAGSDSVPGYCRNADLIRLLAVG